MTVTQEDINVYKELMEHVTKQGIGGKHVYVMYGDSDYAEIVLSFYYRNKTIHHLHDVLVKGYKPDIHHMLQETVEFYYKAGSDGTIMSLITDCRSKINFNFPFIEQGPLDTVGTLNVMSSPDEIEMDTYVDLCYVIYNLLFVRVNNLDRKVHLRYHKAAPKSQNSIEALREEANRANKVLSHADKYEDIQCTDTKRLIEYFGFFVSGRVKDVVLAKTNVNTVFEDSLVTRSLLHTYKDELGEMIKLISEVLSGESSTNIARILNITHEGIRRIFNLIGLTEGTEVISENEILLNILDSRCPELNLSLNDASNFLQCPLTFSASPKTVLYMGLFVLEDLFMFRSKLDSKYIVLSSFDEHINKLSKVQEYNEDGTKIVVPYELIPNYVFMGSENNACLDLLGKLLNFPIEPIEDFDARVFLDTMGHAKDYILSCNPFSSMPNQTLRDYEYVQISLFYKVSGRRIDRDKLSSVVRRLLVGIGIELLRMAS